MYENILKSYPGISEPKQVQTIDNLLIQTALYIKSKKYEKNPEFAYQDIQNEKQNEKNTYQKEMLELILRIWKEQNAEKKIIVSNEHNKNIFSEKISLNHEKSEEIFPKIQKIFNETIHLPELWKPLSINYENKLPDTFAIYHKLYMNTQTTLRYCNCSIIIGFKNESNHAIEVEWGDPYQELYFKTLISPKQVSLIFENKYPLFLFLTPFFAPIIKNISPASSDISILYMWIPEKNNATHSFKFDSYCYKNGTIQLYNNDEKMPILPFTSIQN